MPTNFELKRLKLKLDIAKKPENRVHELTDSNVSLGMRAKNFVFNRGVSCFIRGVSCFIRGVSCFIRGVSCFIRCILSCFIRYNPVFQSWSSRRERVKRLKVNREYKYMS